jgi:uncharacterized RDD family membrane protein YckC
MQNRGDEMNEHETYSEQPNVQLSGEEEQRQEKIYVWYAGFWARAWAYLLDLFIIFSLQRLLITPWFDAGEAEWFSPAGFGMAAVFYLYFILMTKKFGQTLGKMIAGLKVVSLTEEQLTWSTVIFRELIGRYISKAALFLGYAAVAFTHQKRGFHDYFADTLVIHEKRPAYLAHQRVIRPSVK